MDQTFNALTDAQEPVVAAHETETPMGEQSIEETSAQQAVAEPAGEPEQGVQTPEQNEQFKRMRLRAEADARAKMEAEKASAIDAEYAAMYAGKVNEFTGQAITTKAAHEEYVRMLATADAARERGVSFEAQKAYEDEMRKRILESDPEIARDRARLREYVEREREQTFTKDLEAIKQKWPDEKASTINDLGDDFMTLMATGCISAVEAYEVLRSRRAQAPAPPPSTGDITAAPAPEKEFYTPEEVDRLTSSQLDDPKIWKKARASMLKWGTGK